MGSIAVNTTCAVIAIGSVASGRKAAKSVASSVSRSALTTGSLLWLSAVARPWPGICLSTGRTPPSCKPSAIAASKRRHLVRRRCHRRGRRSPDRRRTTGTSASGRQSTSMPSAREIGGDQSRAEPRRRKACRLDRGRTAAIGFARRIVRPMRRPQPLHAAALLIDQHRRVISDGRAKFRDETAHFIGRSNITREKNEPPRLRVAQERALLAARAKFRQLQ